MAQGRAWDKKEIVELLEPVFKLGYGIDRACETIHFPPSTYKTWLASDEELRLKTIAWQQYPNYTARKNIVAKIEDGDTETSKWWAERRERDDFSTKQINDTTLNANEDILNALRSNNASFEKEPETPVVQGVENEQSLPDKG